MTISSQSIAASTTLYNGYYYYVYLNITHLSFYFCSQRSHELLVVDVTVLVLVKPVSDCFQFWF